MDMFKRILAVLIGVTLIGLSVSIFILNQCGSDPISVFAQGFSKILTIKFSGWFTVGNSLITTNIIVFLILISIYKFRYVNIGTFVGMFGTGRFIDIFSKLLGNYITGNEGLFLKTIYIILSVITISVGVGFFISANLGASPVDLISVAISNSTGKKYSIVRIISDTMFVLVGWLLGGTVGISTALAMIFIGPISGFVCKFLKAHIIPA